jgi:hypothetical protein
MSGPTVPVHFRLYRRDEETRTPDPLHAKYKMGFSAFLYFSRWFADFRIFRQIGHGFRGQE